MPVPPRPSVAPCESDDPLALGNQLCFALYAASRTVTRAYQPMLNEMGITYPQYLVLLALWPWDRDGDGPATVGALGQRLLLDSGTLTPLLKRMETAGLVERRRSAADERVTEILLTDTGRALENSARDWLQGSARVGDLDREGLAELRRGLWRLIDDLGRASGE
ncbi:Organic hydroperoxide resistance transcriptional regulator [Microbulbifer aggregans]|uniref:Organic hydroperoxide resistance transcriptional regulator n=1 Tax=Microbulbifer aggregans TaxID=1769779 RepID=A0A1C9W6Z6_9GAMM|nr:MarR family transcriptional regulator [Microbulbifer aggregans]AOS96916.1 Organic hydroperoxide resistance transcriptional regulator [Microbulbifer aggregans]